MNEDDHETLDTPLERKRNTLAIDVRYKSNSIAVWILQEGIAKLIDVAKNKYIVYMSHL